VENQGIRIVLVTPGFISTEISRSALNKDGKATGEMDTNQLHGMSAKECAAIIVNKVLAGKDEFAVGGRETLGILVQRFFPRLFERILRKQPLR
ncbi:MAG: short-chain dehydrogenase, partial [Crocinitomicaceae bacterium]|nr:short-chain dehydrogenase [Crocinitomicaceae bacterium]